jgi:hypothetical protein
MTDEEALRIINKCDAHIRLQNSHVIVDGEMTADELEALAWWVRNHPNEKLPPWAPPADEMKDNPTYKRMLVNVAALIASPVETKEWRPCYVLTAEYDNPRTDAVYCFPDGGSALYVFRHRLKPMP